MKPNNFVVVALALGLLASHRAASLPFPYTTCQQEPAAYSVSSVVTTPSANTYCFNISVNIPPGCAGYCCSADLKKFELNVNSECKVSGAKLSATLNGKPTPTAPTLDRAPNEPAGVILRITNLGLNMADADGAQICVTLGTNSAGRGCLSLEQLCKPPAGGAPGTCETALWDSEFDCCPIDVVGAPTPPPPATLTPEPCPVCINAILTPPLIDYRPFRFDAESCRTFQEFVASKINGLIMESNTPHVSLFTPNASLCQPFQMSVCGTFASADAAKSLEEAVLELGPLFLLESARGRPCHPVLEGYGLTITTLDSPGVDPAAPLCMDVSVAQGCFVPPSPPVNCTCDTSKGSLPFIASGAYAETSLPGLTKYCFKTIVFEDLPPSPCSPTDTLQKIEFYADQSLSRFVKSFELIPTPGTGTVSTRAPSWNAPGSNMLKVTNINWTKAQAANGTVCLNVQKPVTMAELCDTVTCYLYMFGPDRSCCPVYTLNVNPECKVSSAKLSATLNGKPTPTAPTLDRAPNEPAGVILRITNLGLNMADADGARMSGCCTCRN
ncbi:extracellular matrix glycoprotein pherophorin-V16 [Volvox carteri f. nagariensis]|uniref:Extracellular matrix glycoprotein pherophorin-V16 n=1 Tax=Volvox carteri f. nagariensis TaxID=3068 RepID=D8UJL4_VOLCA|nr:extracellular matrix glycoprotein pherophorin-V16 [Volvox carteri f. nagariensis]EFJ40088.1 extracellular matrix glycoprotein pherophorin-V16 [Volvox carteri f. nagariensis]|eukprot:XP_002958837.1 extracellular matrix glycoprotein pherophorin-V16 [Volvox carteri f. nagariensis]